MQSALQADPGGFLLIRARKTKTVAVFFPLQNKKCYVVSR